MLIGSLFAFQEPMGWQMSQEGSRYTFLGPNDEALMVSATLLQGPASADCTQELTSLRNSLLAVIARGAESADLKEVSPIQRTSEFSSLETWWQNNISVDGAWVFTQVAIVARRGAMLVTLESPRESDTHFQVLRLFLGSVEATG